MTIIEQSIRILKSKCLPKQEFFFILASFIVYFKKPLNSEIWNSFSKKIENGLIPIEMGLFMLDEEKNPDIFGNDKIPKKSKLKLKEKIFHIILLTKRELEQKYPNVYKTNCNIVCVPDVIHKYEKPTFFPKYYIENQLNQKNYINELTGHQFSWDFVESMKNGSYQFQIPHSDKIVSPMEFLKQIEKELQQLNRNIKYCTICKIKCKDSEIHKSTTKDYQMIYFCSLDCMEKWDINI